MAYEYSKDINVLQASFFEIKSVLLRMSYLHEEVRHILKNLQINARSVDRQRETAVSMR
jgi:hypothetical protein